MAPDRRLRPASKILCAALRSRSSTCPQPPQTKNPHIERHLLAVLAKVTHLGCWLPTVNLDQLFTKLGGHPSGFEQELSKSEIANFPAPKLVHRFDVQALEHQQIERRHQQPRLFPLPVITNVGHTSVDPCDILARTGSGLGALLLTTQDPLSFA